MSRRPPTQHRAALALLEAGKPVPEVAAELGVPARTVRRWAAELAESAPSRPTHAVASKPPPRLTVVQPSPQSPESDDLGDLALAALLERLRDEPEEVSAADLLRVMAARSAAAERREEEDFGAEPAEVVEAAIGRGWSLAVRRKLAQSLALTLDEVDELHGRAIARGVRALGSPTPERAAEFLLRLRWSEDVAVRAGDLSALARFFSLELRVQGFDRAEPGREDERRPALGPEEIAARREAVRRRLSAGG